MIVAPSSYVGIAVVVPLTEHNRGSELAMSRPRTSSSMLITFIAAAISMFILLMMIYPNTVLTASTRGLAIWWDVLFPSLLPFFIISEALLGFGIVHFIGTLLDPIMRPMFRIPGIGGFVVAMGFASGYPVGAKLTTQLRLQKLISREEGERLVAFTTSSDPIFLIGAVSIGFFGDARLALTIALAHYGSAFVVGLLMRFHAPQVPMTPLTSSTELTAPDGQCTKRSSILIRAFWAMHVARQKDGRSLGTLLQEAVTSSLKLMIVVGGLVVFFSVALDLLTVIGVMHTWEAVLQWFLRAVHLPPSLSSAFSGGIFEVTLGAKGAGAAGSAGMHAQVVAAAWILSWGGLSVHAQIVSIMNQCDLRYMPFLLSRLVHSLLAALAAFILYPLLHLSTVQSLLPAWLSSSRHSMQTLKIWDIAWSATQTGLMTATILIGLLSAASAAIVLLRYMRRTSK